MPSATVSIYTQVYNTKPFLAQCVESVLNQTYRDFEYILIDNGSTDGCKEMLEQYAAQDDRIRLIRFEENRFAPVWLKLAQETASGKYIANIDSDDWWELDYLESLISFLENNHLDLAVTGTVTYSEETQVSQVFRKLKTPAALNIRQFAEHYHNLWIFPSTIWATIMHTELFQKVELAEIIAANLTNGADTVFMVKYLEHCERIGIDNTALYHYRIRPKQASSQYNNRRFDSDLYYVRTLQSFVEQQKALDQSKREWLNIVYFSSTGQTLYYLLKELNMPADDRIAECMRIVCHPSTLAAIAVNYTSQEKKDWLNVAWALVVTTVENHMFTDVKSLESILSVLAPRCGITIRKDTVSLFRDPALFEVLRQDDPDKLAKALLELIQAKRYTDQYDLASMLQALAQDKPLLRGIADVGFMRKYHGIYRLIWEEHTLDALDVMTGLLLENRVSVAEEEFLQLYLSTAALLEQVPAFLFGKVKLAQFYLRQRRREDCQAILSELETMGVEDNEELEDIRRQLAALGEK